MEAITSSSVSAPGPGSGATQTAERQTWTWVVAVWSVVAVFGVVTAFRAAQVDLPMRDPRGNVFVDRLTLSFSILVALVALDTIVRSARSGRGGLTPRRVLATLRERWTLQRTALVVTGLVAYQVVYACYRNLKSWNAFRDQHDTELLRIDKWLFLDNSPAVLLHDLFGEDIAPHVFRAIYESFSVIVPISFVAALVFARQVKEGYVFLTSAMWVWILGVGSYYLIPAIGPFWSAPSEFAGLDPTSVTATQAKYMAQRQQLLDHPGWSDSFSSIGAFASLHTGFTCLIVLMLHYYGFRRATRVAAVYLVAVMVSTIYLGWHFVLDDVAGIIVAVLAVQLGRLTIHGRRRRPA